MLMQIKIVMKISVKHDKIIIAILLTIFFGFSYTVAKSADLFIPNYFGNSLKNLPIKVSN